jgi:RNA-directed DNA polymerase
MTSTGYTPSVLIRVYGGDNAVTCPKKLKNLAPCAAVRSARRSLAQRTLTQRSQRLTLTALLERLNRFLRGWTNYFRLGVSKATFSYLDTFAWRRTIAWLRRKHAHRSWQWLRRRYLPGCRPSEGKATMFRPAKVTVSRHQYRGPRIATPWTGVRSGPSTNSTA